MIKSPSETGAAHETPEKTGFLLPSVAKQLDHDLNNAFAVMIGNLRLLLTGAQDLPREEMLGALADVEHACDEAAVLSRAVLGLMGGIQAQTDGAHPLEEILQRAERAIRRGLRGEIALATANIKAPCSVRAEPTVLEAIIVALALAAQRDLGKRGLIHVTASPGQPPPWMADSSKAPLGRIARIVIEPERTTASEFASPAKTGPPWTGSPVLALARGLCEKWGGGLVTETAAGGLARAAILVGAED
jgi:hypothetical protein